MAETKGSGSASFARVKPDRASPARDTLGFGCTSNERFSKSKYIEPSKLTRSSGKKVPVVVIDASQMWSEAQCQVGGKRFIRMNHTGARIFTAFSQAHAQTFRRQLRMPYLQSASGALLGTLSR
jgi:hypothetical protein